MVEKTPEDSVLALEKTSLGHRFHTVVSGSTCGHGTQEPGL